MEQGGGQGQEVEREERLKHENASGSVLHASTPMDQHSILESLARFEGELCKNSEDTSKDEEEFTSRSSTPLVTASASRPASPIALSASHAPGVMTPKKVMTSSSLSSPSPTLQIPPSYSNDSAQGLGSDHILAPIPYRSAPFPAPVPALISSSTPPLPEKESKQPLASPPRSKSVSPNRPTGAPPSHSSPRKQGK